MRLPLLFLAGLALASPGLAQVNALITDGSRPFAEGILQGYVLQANGKTLCSDPFVIGRYISCRDRVQDGSNLWKAQNRQQVWADTNGTLAAMIVVDSKGRKLCQDPLVQNQFRGPLSYITCSD